MRQQSAATGINQEDSVMTITSAMAGARPHAVASS